MDKVKIGIVGIGDISGIYLKNITGLFKEIEIVGVCDLVREKAERAVKAYNIPKIYDTMYDLFADEEIDIVLNLTRPYEHFGVSYEALKAGKHVYSEKPLGATLEEGKKLVELAKEKNLLIGGAPDTFMGAGIQTARKLIDDGYIGEPVGAAASMICHGHESWHPDPEFYYKFGGGPMMDMGPYYITALINLLGRVNSVVGVTKTSFAKRTITSEPKKGTVIDVDVPTYITGILQFENGAVGTIFTTFDVYYQTQAKLEVYGSKGTLIVPDPNGFGGPVMLLRPEVGEFKEIPIVFDYSGNSRGLGLADMAKAISEGRKFRACSEQTYHVLEILTSFQKSSEQKKPVVIESDFERKKPMVNAVIPGILD